MFKGNWFKKRARENTLDTKMLPRNFICLFFEPVIKLNIAMMSQFLESQKINIKYQKSKIPTLLIFSWINIWAVACPTVRQKIQAMDPAGHLAVQLPAYHIQACTARLLTVLAAALTAEEVPPEPVRVANHFFWTRKIRWTPIHLDLSTPHHLPHQLLFLPEVETMELPEVKACFLASEQEWWVLLHYSYLIIRLDIERHFSGIIIKNLNNYYLVFLKNSTFFHFLPYNFK